MSAHSNLVQVNEAIGRNIHQSQNADVNVVAQTGSHHAHPHWNGHHFGGHHGHHHGHNHHGHGYNHGPDAQVNVIQSNHAFGNNIHQHQNADVNVVAQHGGHHWSGRYQTDSGDAQVNVIQSNQAAGNNIHQVQNADVNVHVRDAFHGHNAWAPTHSHGGYDAGYHGPGFTGGYEHGHAHDHSGAYHHHSGDYGCDVSILPINPGC